MDYEVIALHIGGRGNKIFNAGDKISASAVGGEEAAEKMVASGHLKSLKKKAKQKHQKRKKNLTKNQISNEVT